MTGDRLLRTPSSYTWLARAALNRPVGRARVRSRDGLRRFLSPAMQPRLVRTASLARRIARLALVFATLAVGVLALMRPQTSGGTESLPGRRVGADVMVVLDVSKSMLAEDAAPNRLARAKADVAEFVDRVSGHRVGLVAFAGRPACCRRSERGLRLLSPRARNLDGSVVSLGERASAMRFRKAVAAFEPNAACRG